MKDKKLKFSGLLMCLLVFVVSLLVQLVGGVIAYVVVGIMLGVQAAMQGITSPEVVEQMALEAAADSAGWVILITHLFIILTFGLWYGLGIRKKVQKMPIAKVLAPKNLFLMVVIALGMGFTINFGMEVAVYVIPASVVESYMELMETAGMGENVVTILAAVCLAPIGEELVYRGACMYYGERFAEGLGEKKAFWIANIIQALGFGIFHLNLLQGSYAFLLGLGLGYLTKRYKSLVPAMIGHFVINASSTFLWGPVYGVMPQSTLAFGICALVCLAVTAVAFKIAGNPLTEQEA
ncbi:MAG: CPBP family intramembrane metalloprotease [Lachnospiraceae bacterium]|nr:CPBP family intramembrane metalloprotease [Lachnospiraceae bacterium]